MEKYVYLLKDGNGSVVDAGESHDPKDRLYKKTKCSSESHRRNNFYGRTDITQEIVAGPMPEAEAKKLEKELKLHYGLEYTEGNWGKIQSIKNRKITMEEANEIRAKYVPHKYTQSMLAKEYGLSQKTIVYIIKNQAYTE